jgi:hypothetical protein
VQTSARTLLAPALAVLLPFALAACGSPAGGPPPDGPAGDGAPADAARVDGEPAVDAGPDGAPASARWLVHATASSGFDHAQVELRSDGFWLAGGLGCEPGEVGYLGDAADPGRVALTCLGTAAGFVARFTPSGQVAGHARIDTTNHVRIEAIEPSGDGDGLLVAGRFRGTMRLSPGEPDELELVDRGAYDIFLAAYAADGTLQWATQMGGPSDEMPTAVTRLADGTIAVTGVYAGSATFGSGPTTTVLTSAALDDLFVAGYTPAGELAFAFSAGGPGNASAQGIVALSDGGFGIAGEFQSDLVIGGATLHSAGENDIFVARFTPERTLAWARRAGAVDDFAFGDSAFALVAGPADSLVVAGYFTGPTTFGAGEPNEIELGEGEAIDMFLARYAADGSLAWAREVEGGDTFAWIVPAALAIRGDELFVWGELVENATFGPGEAAAATVTSHGNFDVFIARYGLDGAFHSVRSGGGAEADYAYDLALAAEGAILVGDARITSTLALWSDWAPAFTSTGLSDVFVAAVPDL